MTQALERLRMRRSGMTATGLAAALGLTDSGGEKRMRHLRAWGAVEPAPGAYASGEQHWAITPHGLWMLDTGTLAPAEDRPQHTAADIVPPRQFVNAAIRETYHPPAAAAPMRPGADRAARLPSIMLGRVVMPTAHA